MAKNRDWLKKVGEWLINQSNEENVNQDSDGNTEKSKKKVNQYPTEKPQEVKEEVLEISDKKESNMNETLLKKSVINDLSVERSFRLFLLSWEDEGYSSRYFLTASEAREILGTLDHQFREELKTWLFKCSNQVEIIHDLEKIVKRRRSAASDNINSIRAFSYISVLLNQKQFDVNDDQEEEIKEKRSELINEEKEEAIFQQNRDVLNKQNIHPFFNDSELEENLTKKNIERNHPFGENKVQYIESREIDLNQTIQPELKLGSNQTIQAEMKFEQNHPYITKNISIADLNLNLATYNALRRGNKENICDLMGMDENDFLALRNFGPQKFEELKSTLEKIGIRIPIPIDSKNISMDVKNNLEEKVNEKTLPLKLNYDDVFWEKCKNKFRKEIITLENISSLLDDFTEFTIEINVDNFKNFNNSNNIQTEFNLLISTVKVGALRNSIEESRKKYIISLIFKKFISHDSSVGAKKWIFRFKKLISDNPNYIEIIFRRLNNDSLAEIGNNFDLSRERIRQMEAKFLKNIDISSNDFRKSYYEFFDEIKNAKESELIKEYFSNFNHLPFPEEENPLLENNEFLKNISTMNPFERLEIHSKFNLVIPETEYDYHYDLITKTSDIVGPGYWNEFINLKEYLFRHANFLGEPDLMPKQTSTPRRVASVVQRYGGQSVVAQKIGLQYQGQLVNTDGGRVYWNDERLLKLLDDINIFSKQKVEIMPSHAQLMDFFKDSDLQEYKDKKPGSAVAALTKQGNLAWLEVAQRFNKQHYSGITQKVTVQFIKAFVRDLGEHLTVLSPAELYVLFQAQGINRKEQEKFSRTFDVLIDAVQTGVVDKKDLEDWSNNLEVPSIKELLNLGSEVKLKYSKEEKEKRLLKRRANILKRKYEDSKSIKLNEITKEDLPNLDPGRTLRALDKAAGILEGTGTDAERIEFLKAKASSKLWDSCFADEESLIRNLESSNLGIDTYSEEVRKKFLEEYNGAKNLSIPKSYKFRDLKGRERKPKLMQKLVSFRLLRDKRILNLSGTGTGKTLSAILAAQICNSRRIFISCPNGVIDSWIRTFKSGFPDAILHVKPENWLVKPVDEKVNVVIVNHERFQDRFSDNLLKFCTDFASDMIVIDEIHQSKKRKLNESSQRRSLINQFIRISVNLNPETRVLGLSATPVINNIYEGRSLVELVTQETLFDVKADDELNSCMNLYQHFILNGIRMNPGNLSRTEIIPKNIDASALLPEIIAFTRRGLYHDVERLLVKPKLKVLKECIRKGEKIIIFITNIKGTLIPITNWLGKNKFSFSVYTGDDKEATEDGFKDSLDEFIRGNTEVLVASVQCAGTGVDGLQSVCNKAVFFQLPWTSTEFEQSIGRLDRDGTEFESIKVYLPLTNINLPNGDSWSWCQNKMERIRSKKDIAKAAVDGEIPDADSMFTPTEASKYWLEWLKRLESEN
tara:strand:- start:905 stop:5212 length:4308 start_codon:yes stop_codon:yes gene_type:complete